MIIIKIICKLFCQIIKYTHTHTLLLFSAGEGTMTMKYILKMDTEDISWPKFLKSN